MGVNINRLAVFLLSISAMVAMAACATINPPSSLDVQERMAAIDIRVEELSPLGDEAERHPECQHVISNFEERGEVLESSMSMAMTTTLGAEQRAEVYEVLAAFLELIDNTERDLRACIPPKPTPDPREQDWLDFKEWFVANQADAPSFPVTIPEVPECNQLTKSEVFAVQGSVISRMSEDYGIGPAHFLDTWESSYRGDGENPSTFRSIVEEIIRRFEDAMRDGCLSPENLPYNPQPWMSTTTPVPPTVPPSTSAPSTMPSTATPVASTIVPTAARPSPMATPVPTATKVPTPTPEPLSFTSVSAGHSYTCGVTTGGTVVCWGDNRDDRATPPAGSFASVSSSESYACGVKTDGAVVCWGYDDRRRGTPPAGFFASVSTRSLHVCGVTTSGSAVCWGYNESGQATPPAGSFASVSVGGFHTCGVTTARSAVCWGVNFGGRAAPPAGSFSSVSAGDWHTCGVKTEGSIVCWGDNGEGDDGEGRATPPAGSFTSVSAGSYHTCGVKTDGSVVCWGYDRFGQATPPAGSFASVSAGSYHTCGVKADGSVVCWGHNDSGQATPLQ